MTLTQHLTICLIALALVALWAGTRGLRDE